MRIAGIQKLTLLDYPGHIAAAIFTPGCDLRCPFCHNSELVLDNSGLEYYPDEVLDFLKTRAGKLDGIAITGGEPLLQADLADYIRKLRNLGFKIKLDTNGTFPDRLKALFDQGLVDYVAMDLKNSPESWAKTAGVGGEAAVTLFEKTLRSLEILKNSGVEFELRTTIVKGLHELSDMEGLGKLASGAEKYYLQSFIDSGAILKDGFSAWDKETLNKMLEEVRKYVPEAQLRGVD